MSLANEAVKALEALSGNKNAQMAVQMELRKRGFIVQDSATAVAEAVASGLLSIDSIGCLVKP